VSARNKIITPICDFQSLPYVWRLEGHFRAMKHSETGGVTLSSRAQLLVQNRNDFMIRKTALLTATAIALFAAPALAQEADMSAPAQPEATAQAEGSVVPGAQVQASDGTLLGVLEGATTDATGQQALAVRTEDGSLKTVPMAGASLSDGAVVTAWTEAEFDAALSVDGSTAEASATAPAQPTQAQPNPTEPTEMIDPASDLDNPAKEDPLVAPDTSEPQ
jgi:hypothetical protein